MIRVIFMGTPDYAASILKGLIEAEEIEVVAVYTQPDKPVGRKALMTPPPVKVLAEQAGIRVIQPVRLRDDAVVEELRRIPCDLIIVAAYGQILPKAVLDHAPCINLHASILPHYRGASPIQQSLLNNDETTGVSAMWMDEGLDTGAIIRILEIPIGSDEMVGSLYGRLTDTAVDLTLDVVRHWDRRSATPQNDAEATHCRKITKAEGLIDFSDAREIYNRYRAFTPWPGIYLESGLKIKEMALEEENARGTAGEILRIDKESIVVQCTKGSLRLFKVQAPSKQESSAVDYLNGKRIGCGNILV
ncbi:MAG: methionyl-tRNA formyltransferase [Campylobacterales bacterium]|nr:methionyl-tRNA formyltransferase [Campylobacterales bacterium]